MAQHIWVPLVATFLLIAQSSLLGQLPATGNDRGDGQAIEQRSQFEKAALTESGDIDAGRKLFFDDSRTKCAVCHRVNAVGGAVGPALTHIGGKFDRPHLIESLLEPSRQIVEGYRTTVVLTKDEQVISGILKQRSDTKVSLLDARGNAVDVATSHIQQEKSSDTSLMPADIASSLSKVEFTHLIAFLESLRSGDAKMGSGIAGPIKLPPGFSVSTIATGISGAVAMEVASDGRVFVCEQSGSLRVVKNGRLLPHPFVSIPVQMEWERGLIGVTLDPHFDQSPYVYVCYVAKDPFPHHIVSRFLADGDVAKPQSEEILLVGDDQRILGGNVPAGHQGGALHFGPDGCLYVAIGEQTAGLPSQKLDTFQGKLLRIHRDGSIPENNPLLKVTTGKYRAIWALGLRNPFTFAIHPSTGEILLNDVGGVCEEINRGVPGANYGWPTVEHGPTSDSRFAGPIHSYAQASISGSDFVPETSGWPSQYQGKYLFADFVHGWIHAIAPNRSDAFLENSSEDFAQGLRRPVDMRFAHDGTLYVLLRNAWVVDSKFEGGTSSLLAIKYTPDRILGNQAEPRRQPPSR